MTQKVTTIKDFFQILNTEIEYLVLRNWDDILNINIYGEGHEDIDILCRDLKLFLAITKAERVHNSNKRDNFIVRVANKTIRFDVRSVGDDYYPSIWEDLMLKRRVLNKQEIYTLCSEDYFYSLLYHAILQKPYISSEYINKLNVAASKVPLNVYGRTLYPSVSIKSLKEYLESNNFNILLPRDPGVYVNWRNMRKVNCHFKLSLVFNYYILRVLQRIGIPFRNLML